MPKACLRYTDGITTPSPYMSLTPLIRGWAIWKWNANTKTLQPPYSYLVVQTAISFYMQWESPTLSEPDKTYSEMNSLQSCNSEITSRG